MECGQSLRRGDALYSPSSRFRLALQQDGNLVLYDHGQFDAHAIWASNTDNSPADLLVLQHDGNLCLYVAECGQDDCRWSSGSWGHGTGHDYRLAVQDDGNVVLYKEGGEAIWATNTSQPNAHPVDHPRNFSTSYGSAHANSLPCNACIRRGDAIFSPSRRFFLTLQQDGNLVLYDSHHGGGSSARAMWASNTSRSPADLLVMQRDGNLCLYVASRGQGDCKWSSDTWSHGIGHEYRLSVQDDGNVVLYKNGSEAIWATNTCQSGLQSVDPLSTPQRVHRTGQLHMGSSLRRGDAIASLSGRFLFILQADGNLVLYDGPQRPLWASNTEHSPADLLALQDDGNICLYVANRGQGDCRWSSDTWRHGGRGHDYRLAVQDDGNVVLYKNGREAIWATNTTQANAHGHAHVQHAGEPVRATPVRYDPPPFPPSEPAAPHLAPVVYAPPPGPPPPDVVLIAQGAAVVELPPAAPPARMVSGDLHGGAALHRGDALASASGRLVLHLRPDGRLVLTDGGRAVWAAPDEEGNGGGGGVALGSSLIVGRNGRLELLDAGGRCVWGVEVPPGAGGDGADGPCRLVAQDDGQLALYRGASRVSIWPPTY
ncbi:hypothetical protein HK405_009493 [Cladochytrium tenue]|nr:hypothetical protein HK405_009493 [Cladochytrium tenue]